jgi:hypothetical protein
MFCKKHSLTKLWAWPAFYNADTFFAQLKADLHYKLCVWFTVLHSTTQVASRLHATVLRQRLYSVNRPSFTPFLFSDNVWFHLFAAVLNGRYIQVSIYLYTIKKDWFTYTTQKTILILTVSQRLTWFGHEGPSYKTSRLILVIFFRYSCMSFNTVAVSCLLLWTVWDFAYF